MVVETGGDGKKAREDRRESAERGDRGLERLCCDAAEATAETVACDRMRAVAAAAATPARVLGEPPTM